MIRFRNPGTQYTTQVQVFRELYKEYKDAPSFDLDDMAATIAKTMHISDKRSPFPASAV